MAFESVEDILKELENIHYPTWPLYQIVHGYKALVHDNQDEVTTIYNLSEMHSPELRHRAFFRYEKTLIKEGYSNKAIANARDNLAFECSTFPAEKSVENMLHHMAEMPKEWTVIQMTPIYGREAHLNESNEKYFTGTIYISVFLCGQDTVKPFKVVAKAPVDSNGAPIELAQEMQSIIKDNKDVLSSFSKQRTFRNQQEKTSYFSRRHCIEDRLKLLIKDVQELWLKEWRCLLTGSYVDQNVDKEVKSEINKFCVSLFPNQELSHKIQFILCCLVKAAFQLKLLEVKSVVCYCFPEADNKLLIKVVQFIRNLGEQLALKGTSTKRHPVILVLHDTLDSFPWEMMDVLQDQTVTRIPSIQFLYCLFKQHQHDIQDGYKIIRDYDKGSYIVNPDGDLKSMEVRMMTFFNYWTPQWTGTSGYYPDQEEFFELLTSSDIFTYTGHGSGSHLLSMEQMQTVHVKAVVLLFGCGSAKISRHGPQVEMFGNYHMYLIARCPCVVGTLFEVTDLDTDVLSTTFMAYWIPSESPVHWKFLDKTKWKKAASDKLDLSKVPVMNEDEKPWEPELLRALNLAKKSLTYYTTKCACVVRGLPVKIQKAS